MVHYKDTTPQIIMGDFLDYFKNKKNLINLLLMGILILALPLGIAMLRQQQIIKSRAAGETIVFTGDNVVSKNGQWVATAPQITLNLTSPLGPAGQSASVIQTGQVQGAFMSRLAQGLVKTAYAEGALFPCNRPNQLQIGDVNSGYTCAADANGCIATAYAQYTDNTTDDNGDGTADPNDPGDQPWCDNNCGDPKSCPEAIPTSTPTPTPSASPAGSCTVSNWSFTPNNPASNTTVRATVTGVNDPGGWQDVAYKKETDINWVIPSVTVTAGPTFSFDVNSGSNGAHTVTLGVNKGARSCTPTGNFTTGSNNNGGTCDLTGNFNMTDACATCVISQAPQNQGGTLVDSIKALGAQYGNQWGGCTNTQLVGKWCSDINKSTCDAIKVSTPCVSVCNPNAASCSAFSPNGLSDNGQVGSGGIKIYTTADYKGGRRLLNITRTPATAVIAPSSTKDPAGAADLTFEKAVDGSGNWLTNIPDNTSASVDNNYTLSASVSAGSDTAACTPFIIRVPKQPTNTVCSADITSTQARMRVSETDSWSTDLTITVGGSVFAAGFHNNQTDQAAPDVILKAVGPDGPSSHEVTISGNTFNPALSGKYTITATTTGKAGQNCTGSATLTVKPVPVTTVSFRVAESLADLAGAPWENYTADPMPKDYTFKDQTPGVKTIFVQFKDSNGTLSTSANCPKCQAQIRLLSSGPAITGCKLSFEGVNTVLNITGQNFGSTRSVVKSGENSLQIRDWRDNGVTAVWGNAPSGEVIPITLTNSDGQSGEGQCSAVSQLSFGARLICQSPSSQDIDNVDLSLGEPLSSAKIIKQKVKIDKDGIVQGLTQKLEAGKQYFLSIKAPNTLRKTSDIFTAGGGMTIIPNFVLPVGDIFPTGSGDGVINALDKSELNRQWIINASGTGRSGDFNRDGRVNSIDWACMRYGFGKSDDVEAGGTINPNPGGPASPSSSLQQ